MANEKVGPIESVYALKRAVFASSLV